MFASHPRYLPSLLTPAFTVAFYPTFHQPVSLVFIFTSSLILSIAITVDPHIIALTLTLSVACTLAFIMTFTIAQTLAFTLVFLLNLSNAFYYRLFCRFVPSHLPIRFTLAFYPLIYPCCFAVVCTAVLDPN